MTEEYSLDLVPPGSTRWFRFLKGGRRITVVKSPADDLPSGWITELEIRRNGNGVRKDRYYTDPASGYVFRSKTSVLHYLETGEITGGAFWRNKDNDYQILTEAESYYSDPESRYVFRSKTSALRYLETGEITGGAFLLKKGNNDQISTKADKSAVIQKSAVDDLPSGWIMEVKIRRKANGVRKDKYYTDPTSGCVFRSKTSVLRYLETGEITGRASLPKKGYNDQIITNADESAVMEISTVDGLPSGLMKEIKIKRNANGVRKDKYYTDPASGYVFRSKTSVLRYLETGEITGGAFLRKNGNGDQIMTKANESSAVDENEHPEWLPKNWLMEVKTSKSGATIGKQFKLLRFYSKPEVLRFLNHSERRKKPLKKKKTASDSRKKEDDLLSEWIKEVKIKRNANEARKDTQFRAAKRRKVKRLANRRQLVTGWETSNGSINSDLENETFEEGQTDKDYAETGVTTSSVIQIPQRKGSVENAITINLETAEKSSWSSSVARKASSRKQRKIVSADKTENRSSMNSTNSGKSKNKKELGLPREFLDRLEPEQVASGVEHTKHCQNVDDDVLEKQPQMLEMEKKTSDTKSEIHHLLSSDPFLEFPTKTLKGGVPHENAADKDLGSTPVSSVLVEMNLGKTRERKRSNMETKNLSKSKKIKELVAVGVSTEIVIQNATSKSGKNEAKPPCVLVDEETRQLNVDRNAKFPNQACPAAVNPEINNMGPHEDKTMLVEQPQISGTKKCSDSKSEVEPLFCSEPCLESGIKTFAGAISFEDSINEGVVSASAANIQQQMNIADTRIEHGRCRKTLFNSTRSKKDSSLPQHSSERVAEHEAEPVASSFSNEQVLNFADGKSYGNKAIRNADLTSAELTEKLSQQLEIGPRMAYESTLSHEESSNKSKEPRNSQTIPRNMNNENPGQQSAIPSWSTWSGPCFKSPFRTVADSSSAEGCFVLQRNSRQQFGRDGNFASPDHCFPYTFQNSISSHVDPMGQPVLQQQFPPNLPGSAK